MNRAELVDSIASTTGQTKQQVHDTTSAILHSITSALAKGERVMLVGFGTFERRNRRARVGVNPQDPRKKLTIAAARVPVFRAGAELKAVVDGRQRLTMPNVEGPTRAASGGKKAKPAAKKTAKKPAAKKTKKSGAKKRR